MINYYYVCVYFQGNKKRKRNLEGNSDKRQKQDDTQHTEGGDSSEPSFKKFKKQNVETEGNTTAEHHNDEEHAVANISQGAKDNVTENSKDESRPSRKERSEDFKGLIAKKKKVFRRYTSSQKCMIFLH